jgi:uncharacterized phiE125 gp8 family phage protein
MSYPIAPVRTVAPAAAPVTLAEAKAHLRVTDTNEDPLIAAMIDAAVSHLDGYHGILGRCMVTQTWRQDAKDFPKEFVLPFVDVQSVTVAYSDTNNAAQVYSAASYHLVNTAGGSQIVLAKNATWPSVYDRPDAVRVTMVCGFAAVPQALKMAILLHVGALFENRASESAGALMPFAYDALIAPFRVVGV